MNTPLILPTRPWPDLPAAPDAAATPTTPQTIHPQPDLHPPALPAGQSPAHRAAGAAMSPSPDLLPRRPTVPPFPAPPFIAAPHQPPVSPPPLPASHPSPPSPPPQTVPARAVGHIDATYVNAPTSWEKYEQFCDFLIWCHGNEVNDVTLSTGKRILGKRHGFYRPVTERPLTDNDMRNMYKWCKNDTSLSSGDTFRGEIKIFLNQELRERLRARVSIKHMTSSSQGLSITMRLIPNTWPTAAHLQIPPELLDAFSFKYGLGLTCGKMESGKTWTQAALIEHWLSDPDFAKKIMHFGTPIEFLFEGHPGEHQITQHEIPKAIRSYPDALRIAKSSSPDIIIMEEANDKETVSMMIDAAQSGIAVLGTLHISKVPDFPGALLTYYTDADERDARLYAAIDAMQVILVQRLEPAIVDGDPTKRKGRVCLREYLILDEGIRTRIKEHPPRQWSEILNRLVHEAGTTMLQSARAYHAEGRLSDDQLSRIERGKA